MLEQFWGVSEIILGGIGGTAGLLEAPGGGILEASWSQPDPPWRRRWPSKGRRVVLSSLI